MSNSRRYALMKMDPAYKFLVDNYKGKLPYDIRSTLKYEISGYRRDLRNYQDDLALKLHYYGNSGQWGAQLLRDLSRVVFDTSKTPQGFEGDWLSVEIECFFASEKRVESFAKQVRALGLSKLVTIKNDASLNPHEATCDGSENEDGECSCGIESIGKEIIVSFRKSNHNPLFQVCEILNKLGCWVNRTCGLHVHFDMRGVSSRTVTLSAARLGYCVPALKTMLPKSRRNNRFCQEPINSRRGGSRYAFVNTHSIAKHGTLEVRGHSGTTDAEKISKWIALCIGIMQCKAIKSSIDSLDVVLHLINPSSVIREYCLERRAKFSPEAPQGVDQVMTDNDESTTNGTLPEVLTPPNTVGTSF